MSLKNTYKADRIKPTPILNIIRVMIGYINIKKLILNLTPSTAANIKKIISVSPKLTRADIFLESKNNHLGTLTLVNIPLLAISDCIP